MLLSYFHFSSGKQTRPKIRRFEKSYDQWNIDTLMTTKRVAIHPPLKFFIG